MTTHFRIFGSELSPYSVKVRSYFRYKKIPHEWIVRSSENMDEFKKYAKLPLIPLVITPDGQGMQDSTPIIEELESRYRENPVQPEDPTLAFLSALIEDYGDEWMNKPMFHYRWNYEPDQLSAAERIARDNLPGADDDQIRGAIDMIRGRMVPRLSFVGSSAATAAQIEGSFLHLVEILEDHLSQHAYLLGKRPALADFGLYAQLYECSTDPTPSALLEDRGPAVLDWIERMLWPRAEGSFESWESLADTLTPLLRDEVGGIFLPWSAANAQALSAGEKEFTVEFESKPFSQETQKYHAKSLGVLRDRYGALGSHSKLDSILDDTGCLKWLR